MTDTNSSQPLDTIEDVRTACIELTHLAQRLGGEWELMSARDSTGQTKVFMVKLWIPTHPPQPDVRQMPMATGEE